VTSTAVYSAIAQPDGPQACNLTVEQRAVYVGAASAFRAGRHTEAFSRFAELADAGHAPSAEAALFMLHNGQLLFGSDWDTSSQRRTRWKAALDRQAGQQGPGIGSSACK
jgi:hypothetical protein